MKQPRINPFAAGLLLLATSGFAQSTYTIDPSHSSAEFSVRHMMVSNVRGQFAKVTGTVVYDPANPAATKIDASIDASTISTNNEKRDAHLRSADFFDTAKYPTITFRSKNAWKAGGVLQVQGELTMHGVTREVVLRVEPPAQEIKDAWGNVRVGATATTKLNRSNWGLTWNKALEAGGVAVSDEVAVTLDIAAVKQKPAK